MRGSNVLTGLTAASLTALGAGTAMAQDSSTVIGRPVAGGMGFQPSATELARDIVWLDSMVHWISTGIVAFVVLLLLIVIVRYNSKANPKSARFTHNTPVEVAWTLIPIVILVFIGAFSLPILFKQQEIPEGEVVIKATGAQWYWSYEYPEEGIAFDSAMIGSPFSGEMGGDYRRTPEVEEMLKSAGYEPSDFLLAADNAIVVPINKIVVIQVTASDVIHAWALPAFGVKQDGVPGRIAELWFKPERLGVYFGQCSELCGKDHAYMPITVKVVTEAEYDAWLTEQKNASLDVPRPVQLAAAN